MLDYLTALGFLYATKSGMAIGIDDMVTPSSKKGIIEKARVEVDKLQKQYEDATMTNMELANKHIGRWR